MIPFKTFLKEASSPDSVEKLHDALSKHYNHSEKHKETLQKLSHKSADLNAQLHNKAGKLNTSRTKAVDSALTQHKAPKSFHVYSGLSRPGSINLKSGTTHTHHGYLHTSLSHEQAKHFSDMKTTPGEGRVVHRHILKIHVPKGHPGSYVGHISKKPEEKEFILPRNTSVHIHHTETSTSKDGNTIEHTHTHHAKIVS